MDPIEFHKKYKGKIRIEGNFKIKDRETLSLAYTPGVAEVVKAIDKNPDLSFDTTLRGRTVLVLSNSTRVLGLGKVKVEAGLPVMEGKSLLMKEFGGVDSFPLCVKLYSLQDLIDFSKAIQYSFAAINLEDISSPLVFNLYDELYKELEIPVFHDDRHGTGIVVLAGLINALKLVEKEDPKILVIGLGSAGYGIIEMLSYYGFKNILAIDSRGVVCLEREGIKGSYKEKLIPLLKNICISREEAFRDADVIIAASSPGSLREEDLKLTKNPIIFTLANPVPEIPYEIAKKYGSIVFTGRSDLPNQINNLLAFPGIFKGALKAKARKITKEMMLEASLAIAECIKPTFNQVIPSPLDKKLHECVGEAVYKKALELGLTRD